MSSKATQDNDIQRRRSGAGRLLLNLFLLALVLLGIGCRFYGLNWDDSRLLHPDERFLASTVMRLQVPQGVGEYFNSRVSPLNPANIPDVHYVYGQLPVTLGRILANAFGVSQDDKFLVYGRVLSAAFDCLTVLFTFLLGRRLLGMTAGLFAAALVALAALHIQQSHFFVVDTFSSAFVAGALWCTVRWADNGKPWEAAAAGLLLGLAMACKISAFTFGIAVLAGGIVIYNRFEGRKAVTGAAVLLGCTLLAFRVAHPMAFQGEWGPIGLLDLRPEPRFWSDLSQQSDITRGVVNVPFNIQWIGRTAWLYPANNLVVWGYGYGFSGATILGLFMLVRLFARQKKSVPTGLLIVAIFGIAVFVFHGAAFSKFTRYYLPITGACAIVAAFGIQETAKARRVLGVAFPAVAVVTAGWALAVTSIYGRQHPRIAATYWIRQNIEPRTVVATETAWDEGLPLSWVPNPDGTLEPDGLIRTDLKAFDDDNAIKRLELLQKLNAAEWIFVSSPRAWATIPRWQQRFPVMTAYYTALFNGRLGFDLVKEFESYPRLGPWQFADDGVEEALTVYDHPRVLLFKKTDAYSSENAQEILFRVPLPSINGAWRPRDAGPVGPEPLPIPPRTATGKP